jgi:predicted dehydrogenase
MKTNTTHPAALPRRAFLKTLTAAALAAPFVTRDLLADPPSGRLRHAAVGLAHMGWQDLQQISSCDGLEIAALCDVDDTLAAKARETFPDARFFRDWREMLAKMGGSLDSINVSTPDHMHAPIAVAAMSLGLHAYVEKPLAHELYEVRRMREIARAKKLVTQMGIQITSNAHYRIAVAALRAGAIGKVREAHSWCYKTWGDPSPKPDRADPVPATLSWDNWLGVRDARPYIGDISDNPAKANHYYHPTNWRKRLDFGTGTLGDMACHIFDPVFGGLGLGSPVSVRSDGPAPAHGNWGIDARVTLAFAPTPVTAAGAFRLYWYDGAQRPPAEITGLVEPDKLKDNKLPDQGTLFVGENGVLLLPHIARAQLFPTATHAGYQLPREKGANHWKTFVEACRGNDKTTTGFDYAGPLTEAVLLGGVAARFPKTTLKWDSDALKFDLKAADKFIRRPYRQGWEVAGL